VIRISVKSHSLCPGTKIEINTRNRSVPVFRLPTAAFYRFVSLAYVYPSSRLWRTTDATRRKYAISDSRARQRRPRCELSAVNLLCSVPTAMNHYPLLRNTLRTPPVFISVPERNRQKRAWNSGGIHFHACADKQSATNYGRAHANAHLRLRVCRAIPKHFRGSEYPPWSFIRRFIAHVLGAPHTNPLTGTNFGAYDSEASCMPYECTFNLPV